MKTLYAGMIFLFLSISNVNGNEWVPYNPQRTQPIASPVVQLPMIQQYPVIAVPVIVPLMVPYVPVVTYDSILVEQKQWCLFKRYEWVQVPRVHYVPMAR
jgi:hypothetical protein